MKQLLRYALIALTIFFSGRVSAQNNAASSPNTPTIFKDSIVELYGLVMTSDSLRGIEAASVIDKGRGTFTNEQGVFSLVVVKGDKVRFSCVGFKDRVVEISKNLPGNQYSVIELMTSDTAYLPATILRARPSAAQFERDFVNTEVPADQLELARESISEAKRRVLLATLPADSREAVNMQLRQQAQKFYYQGQIPPMNILNPMAWAEFIQAWKRGDFKSSGNQSSANNADLNTSNDNNSGN